MPNNGQVVSTLIAIMAITTGLSCCSSPSPDRPSGTATSSRATISHVANHHPLDKMVIAFEGNHTRDEIKRQMDRAMQLYGLELTEENYMRAGGVLVRLRNEFGPTEMEILDYMIRSYVPGVKADFVSMAAISVTMLATRADRD